MLVGLFRQFCRHVFDHLRFLYSFSNKFNNNSKNINENINKNNNNNNVKENGELYSRVRDARDSVPMDEAYGEAEAYVIKGSSPGDETSLPQEDYDAQGECVMLVYHHFAGRSAHAIYQ